MVSMDDRFESEVKEADALWSKGHSLLEKSEKEEAETAMRSSLLHLRDAYHLASEDLKLGNLLHERGIVIHNLFGCKVRMKGTTYYQECPVILSHVQLGFSIGGSADTICSICGKDPWDCEHIKGLKYDGVVCRRIGNTCNICLNENCNHLIGEIYNGVEVVHILTNMKLDHVSLVENPANPLARFQMYTLSADDIRNSLPKSERRFFVPGKTVIHCHHCVECNGSSLQSPHK